MNIIIKKNLSKIVAFTAATVLVLSPGISDNAVSAHPIPEQYLSGTTPPDTLHDLFAYTDEDSLRNDLRSRSLPELRALLPAILQTYKKNYLCVKWIIDCMRVDPTFLLGLSDKSSEDIETITKQANATFQYVCCCKFGSTYFMRDAYDADTLIELVFCDGIEQIKSLHGVIEQFM